MNTFILSEDQFSALTTIRNSAFTTMWLPPLNSAMQEFEINTPERAAAFLAQAIWESQHFTKLEENLSYSSIDRLRQVFPSHFNGLPDEEVITYCKNPEKLGNLVYANKNGNSVPESGEGYKYRGRGVFQLTGKRNYVLAGFALNLDLVGNPDMARNPSPACRTAGWFWCNNKLNSFADTGCFDTTTKILNGPGMAGAPDRRSLYQKARRILGVK